MGHWNCLVEAVLTSTHSLCFGAKIRKIYKYKIYYIKAGFKEGIHYKDNAIMMVSELLYQNFKLLSSSIKISLVIDRLISLFSVPNGYIDYSPFFIMFIRSVKNLSNCPV